VSTVDIKALIMAEGEKQLAAKNQLDADQAAAVKAASDKAAADAVAAAEAAKAAISYKRVENIGGHDMEFDGNSEAEVDRLILNAYKVAYTVRPPAEHVAQVDTAAVAAKAAADAEAQVAAKAELERKFRLNEISAAEYIQQSGAVKSYLESEGVSIEALRDATTEKQGKQFEQSWKQAGESFAKTPAGANWPGGARNQELLGLKVVELGLVDAPDKVAAIAQAYEALKQKNMLFPADVVETTSTADAAAKATADATVAKAAMDAAAAATETARASAAATALKARTSSSMFGQSSGVSGAPITAPVVAEAAKVVPDNATPAEIILAWKESQLAAGKNLDEVFMETHRGHKI
jgi:hypothetical protein